MKISDIFEGKTDKKPPKPPTPRNFVAKHAQKSGAGTHDNRKPTDVRGHKHKGRENSRDEG